MDSFEVPKIPKIFVPQNVFRTESQNQSKPGKTSSKAPIKEISGDIKQTNESKSEPRDVTTVSNIPPTPKLCASCSQILLTYLAPLQRLVNEVVQIAGGDPRVTSSPLVHLFNAEVLNSVKDDRNAGQTSDEQQPDNYQINRESADRFDADGDRRSEQIGDQHYEPQHYERGADQSNYQTHPSHGSDGNYNQDQPNYQHKSYENESYDQNNYRHEERHDNRVDDQRGVKGSTQSEQTFHSVRHSEQNFEEKQLIENQTNAQQITDNSGQRDGNQRNVVKPDDSQRQESTSHYVNEPQTQESDLTRNQNRQEWATQEVVYEEHSKPTVRSPYAFVTIVYNNLSATNAIILANSLVLTNNKSMLYFDNNGNKTTIEIPFVILIGGNIDPILKEAIYMVFDEVISQPMDVKLALLSDHSFGVRQTKLQMWKELENYSKCLYLESSTLVVGRVTNLFEECRELSACVDMVFPDTFNCSVFVFEPSLTTYEEIISFAVFHQKCSAQRDESAGEALDEMTLLNQFFAAKWNRISFVYNYVKSEAVYTHIPAFMKYGDSIKIVNFGHMLSQMGGMGSTQPTTSSVQPWHVMVDLLASGQQDVVKSMPIDNFTKFYLNCFIQRLWPILQRPLTPLLVSKYGIGRRDWSIFDLIRLLSNESGIETDDHMFTQTPITFRRIRSPADKIAKYESLSVEEDEDLSQNIKDLELEETEASPTTSPIPADQESSPEDQNEPNEQKVEQKAPQLSEQEQDDRSKSEWEAGRIDWMGAHQSDRIINRLKKLIRND